MELLLFTVPLGIGAAELANHRGASRWPWFLVGTVPLAIGLVPAHLVAGGSCPYFRLQRNSIAAPQAHRKCTW
jgi:hypothetical protein